MHNDPAVRQSQSSQRVSLLSAGLQIMEKEAEIFYHTVLFLHKTPFVNIISLKIHANYRLFVVYLRQNYNKKPN